MPIRRDRVQEQLKYAFEKGLCPICKNRPRAVWPDTGSMRVTCGDAVCMLTWLPGDHRGEIEEIAAQRELDSLEGDGTVILYKDQAKVRRAWGT